MKIPKSITSALMLLSILVFLSGCEFLMDEPRARTNPGDENSAVYYFRATPQYDYSGYSMQYARLTWKWAADVGKNQGKVKIMRRDDGIYPQGVDDTNATTVYSWSSLDDVEIYDDLGGDKTGSTFKYTLYYTVKGDDQIYERNAAETVFELQTLTVPCSFVTGLYYDSSTYQFTSSPVTLMVADPYYSYGLIAPDFSLLTAWNIDIYSIDFYYYVSLNTAFTVQRITTPYPDDKSAEYYFNLITSSSTYSSTNEVTVSTPTVNGSSTTSTNMAAIFNYWLDTLEFYGLRVSVASGTNTLQVTTGAASDTYFDISYVGPAP